jgi:quinol monooxygenase YgiN
MIKHIVAWKLKDHAAGNDKHTNAARLKQGLEALRGKIPGLLTIEVGLNFNPAEDASDVVLYSEFTDRAALDAYLNHPDHLALVPFAREVRLERRVMDYEANG